MSEQLYGLSLCLAIVIFFVLLLLFFFFWSMACSWGDYRYCHMALAYCLPPCYWPIGTTGCCR